MHEGQSVPKTMVIGPSKEVPSPDQVAAANERLKKYAALTFEIQLSNGWTAVRIAHKMPLYNPINPSMSLLIFRLEPVVPTPYLPSLEGLFWLSSPGLKKGVVTWIPDASQEYLIGKDYHRTMNALAMGKSYNMPFRCQTQGAGEWLVLQLAKAAGMKFREHDMAGNLVYTREP
jgi:hypothetical protein